MEEGDRKTYSVQVTVQRTIKEYGFVSVLVTSDLVGDNGKLNVEKLMECAKQSASSDKMSWYGESLEVDLNPLQKPRQDEKILRVNSKGLELDET